MDREAALRRAREPFVVGGPLRGIAALAVALGHILGAGLISWIVDGNAPPGPIDAWGAAGDLISPLGTAGVSVFFVLSGYLLSRPFVRAAVLGDRRPGLGRFARNRVLRIVPAYWALLTILVVTVVLTGVEDAGAVDLLTLYAFAGGLERPLALWVGHSWTLDVEAQFYVCLGLAGTAVVLLRARAWMIAALAIAVAAWSFGTHESSGFDIVSLGDNVGRFSAGILLAVAEVVVRGVPRSRALCAGLFAGGIVALVAAAVAREDPSDPLGNADLLVLTLASGAVVAGPLLWQWAGGAPSPVLDNSVLRWAGTRSYALYLVHLPVYVALCTALADDTGYKDRSLLLALAGLPLALGAAELLHRLVEVPFLRRRAPSQSAPDAPRDPAPI